MTTAEKIRALEYSDDDKLCQMWAAHASAKDALLALYIDENSEPLILSDREAERRGDDVVFIAGLYDWEGAELREPDRSYEAKYEYAKTWMFDNVDTQADYVEKFSPKHTAEKLRQICRGEYDWQRQRDLGLAY